MQYACAVLYCNFWPAQLYSGFLHCLVNGTIYEKKKVIKRNTYVLFDFLCNFCLKHFSFQEEFERDIKNVYYYSRKLPVIPVRFA